MRRAALAVIVANAAAAANVVPLTLSTGAPIGQTHPTQFASFSFDTTALFGVQRTGIPFGDARLRKLAQNLAPAFLRVGGSLQDNTIYNVSGQAGAAPWPLPSNYMALYLNSSTWDTLLDFVSESQLDLVFGLNADVGRLQGPWNASHVASLLQYAASKRQRIPVVELGNEVNVFNCSHSRRNITSSELAGEYATLRATLNALMPGTELWGSDSSITGDYVGQCHSYYGDNLFGFNADFFRALNASAPGGIAGTISAHTWHYYSQASFNATSTAALVLSNEFQDRLARFETQARAVRDALAPGTRLVLGETASFWAGGAANVSNRFASGHWYLPQLGYLATHSYWTHIRQDLAGGDYGLVELQCDPMPCGAGSAVVGYSPNPDYFTHALWQRLVSGTVLSAAVGAGGPDAAGVRAFAFCAAAGAGVPAGSVTIVAVNLRNATAQLLIALTGGGSLPATRQEYLLTPGDEAGLASQLVRLNGAAAPLALQPDLSLPDFPPAVRASSEPLTLPPASYGFAVLPGAAAPACL